MTPDTVAALRLIGASLGYCDPALIRAIARTIAEHLSHAAEHSPHGEVRAEISAALAEYHTATRPRVEA